MFIGLYIDSANVALILCKIKGFMKMKVRKNNNFSRSKKESDIKVIFIVPLFKFWIKIETVAKMGSWFGWILNPLIIFLILFFDNYI